MHFNFITLFPSKISSYFEEGLQQRAMEKGILTYKTILLRDFGDKWGRVDDTVYGGGPGMLLKVEPVEKALRSIPDPGKVILLSPSGSLFTQKKAEELSKLPTLTFISGYYEGIDHRVTEHLVDVELSIGKYVISSGDLAALCISDSVLRLIPGFMGGGEDSLKDESHSIEDILDYPQYTKPASYKGWDVPEVLLNGHHGEIKKWKETHRKSPFSE
ncbi:MAG: tRNA (guanosine(37)-N1)-methyltransferase TrmD [Spirochaetia bacterium]|nr:tRNA (guanosine(37)-N1)-methyltransferase TrmD [Spirochaetia bacterium]